MGFPTPTLRARRNAERDSLLARFRWHMRESESFRADAQCARANGHMRKACWHQNESWQAWIRAVVIREILSAWRRQ